ncbi:uncharacterized protein LOC124151893 [Haliotis rufescens]|uniref:uncharacterized protein LOC124151893 n=1 Tax=Haliotis rufescens TaxID=6454 RepID=UPI001EB0258E|nr:uncharacterized protein LOC124151893 [Haliotis rufescens]
MEYHCSKAANGVWIACVWLALATRLTVMAANTNCFDWKGNKVENGAKFIPNNEDPCMKCTCHNGFTIMCQDVVCHPPENKCLKLIKVEEECCEYQCLDPPRSNPDLPGMDNSTIGNGGTVEDDSITNLGLRLVASTVTSFLVLALLLFMVHRLRQRRLLLAMRRFEAQSRRQQLEESDSDPYIPDTYFGMIECPPYEDPPPPYSSPKPNPHIMPGEAPPPYEEVDQNHHRNNNNNNNLLPSDTQTISSRSQGTQACNQYDRTSPGQDGVVPRPVTRRSLFGTEITDLDQRQANGSCSAGRVRCESSSQRAPKSEVSGREAAIGVSVVGSDHSNSLGRVSNSTDSTESHNCSCDSEQTLLKKTVCNDKANWTSQTLPLGFCIGQDRMKGRKAKQHSPCPRTSRSCQGQLNPAADMSWSPANSSQSLPQEANPCSSGHQYSSLPPRLHEAQQAESTGTSGGAGRTLAAAAAAYHPLAEEPLDPVLNCPEPPRPTTSHSMSQSCVILREKKHERNDQEQLRKSLPPLDFPSNSPSASEANPQAKDAEHQASENQHRNSNEYLRNIRLSNLLNSPVTSFDGPASPGSPVARSMRRSHSVTSDISVFSVCSETGEKRSKAAAAAAGRVLRNDSQYPDIPISAHAMRMATLAQQVDGQGHHDSHLDGEPTNDGARDDGLPTSGKPASDEGGEGLVKPRLNAIEEGGADQALNSVTMHNPGVDAMSPKVHRSKKKDKHKQNRHSTGSVMQGKPKKHAHSSSSAAQLPPSGEMAKRGEAGSGTSPSHRKRSDKVHGSPSSKASGSPSNKPGTGKGDSSKKKPGKQVCDSYKQYGFIDDPNFLQSRNGIVELRLVDPEDVECPPAPIKLGAHNDKSLSGCENKQQSASLGKPGGKRHFTSSSSYSPSPTRQKSSRPRSFAHPTGACEGSPGLGVEGSHSPMVSQGTPRRKSRNATKSKKRVSYPVTGAEVSHDVFPQSGEQEDQPANGNPVLPELANQESGQSSLPLGLITVRNGPLSSYV